MSNHHGQEQSMNQNEFEKLCRQIADVPWDIQPGKSRLPSSGLQLNPGWEANLADGLCFTVAESSSGVQWGDIRDGGLVIHGPLSDVIRTAAAAFSDLELRHIAREIAPNAPWNFYENNAYARDFLITRRPPQWVNRWGLTLGPKLIVATSTAELIAAYRERRSQHEAARGVKTRQRKPQRERQTGYYADGTVSVEHARNILRCLAEPERYTLIAEWASNNCGASEQVLRRALETK